MKRLTCSGKKSGKGKKGVQRRSRGGLGKKNIKRGGFLTKSSTEISHQRGGGNVRRSGKEHEKGPGKKHEVSS